MDEEPVTRSFVVPSIEKKSDATATPAVVPPMVTRSFSMSHTSTPPADRAASNDSALTSTYSAVVTLVMRHVPPASVVVIVGLDSHVPPTVISVA